MSLIIQNESFANFDPILDSFVTSHNGYTGGADEFLFYLKNDDLNKTYRNIQIKPVFHQGELEEGAVLTNTGWSVKIAYGSDLLSEREWDEVPINQICEIESISNDITLRYPVRVRIYCPGKATPQVRLDLKLNLSYIEEVVV